MTKKQKPNRPSNWVIQTVRIVTEEPHNAVSPKGTFWVNSRGAISMGKDEDGNYKPSLFVGLKAFSQEGDDGAYNLLINAAKGDYVTVKGRLAYREYTRSDGSTGSEVEILVQEVEPFYWNESDAELDEPDFD